MSIFCNYFSVDMTFSPVWRRQKDMIMKIVLLVILALPPLNFTFTGSLKSKEELLLKVFDVLS